LIKLSEESNVLKYCFWDFGSFIINYQGEAVLCCEDYFNTVKLGNVGNKKLIDIWRGSHYMKLRKELQSGIFNYDLCKKCSSGKFSD